MKIVKLHLHVPHNFIFLICDFFCLPNCILLDFTKCRSVFLPGIPYFDIWWLLFASLKLTKSKLFQGRFPWLSTDWSRPSCQCIQPPCLLLSANWINCFSYSVGCKFNSMAHTEWMKRSNFLPKKISIFYSLQTYTRGSSKKFKKMCIMKKSYINFKK